MNVLTNIRAFLGATHAGTRAKPEGPQEEGDMFTTTKARDNGSADVGKLFSAAQNQDTRRGSAWLAARIERSKHFVKNELDTETVTVTPALAELMLERNEDNRPIRRAKVRALANTIADGRWKLTAQGISFSRDGTLNDGQHRLAAIIESGRAVDCRVTFGESRDVFDVLDTGSVRNGGDTLHIAGYQYWNLVSAGARLFLSVTGPTPLGNPTYPNDAILKVVEDNPSLADAAPFASKVCAKLRAPSGPVVAAFALILASKHHGQTFDDFVEAVAEGVNLGKRNPALTIRNMLATKAFDATRGNNAGRGSRICAGIILAWNKFSEGKNASERQLRWNGETAFPQPE